jgi:hypothetical protein
LADRIRIDSGHHCSSRLQPSLLFIPIPAPAALTGPDHALAAAGLVLDKISSCIHCALNCR